MRTCWRQGHTKLHTLQQVLEKVTEETQDSAHLKNLSLVRVCQILVLDAHLGHVGERQRVHGRSAHNLFGTEYLSVTFR